MFRSPRATKPGPAASNLGQILEPFPVILWGSFALAYLGVPIVLGVRFTVLTQARCLLTLTLIQLHMIVVSDEHYQSSIQKLIQAKFRKALPARGPPPEVAAIVPSMKMVREELDAGYRSLDQSTTWFDYPAHY